MKAHAIAVPLPIQGHINPLLQLCRALARNGIVITFVNTEGNHACMKEILQEDGLEIRYETIPDHLPVAFSQLEVFYGDNRTKLLEALDKMEHSVEVLLRDKLLMQEPPVSCIISDAAIKWASNIASRMGIINVMLWASNVSYFLVEKHVLQLLENGDIPVEDASTDKAITCVPGLGTFPAWSLPYIYRAEEAVLDPGFSRRLGRAQNFEKADYIVINSVQELEPEPSQALSTSNVVMGPMLLLENERAQGTWNMSVWKEDEKCLEWLSCHGPESVLYISFGSIASLSMEQVEEIAEGLEELGRPYLWVLRLNAVRGLDFEALSSKVRDSGKGLLISWAPQVKVLGHPATGGFLTHCGWNSTLESICSGVPMLCWPCVSEQNLNCKLIVEDLKIGLKFSNVASRGLVSRKEVTQAGHDLMGGEVGTELKKNVKLLQASVQGAVSAEGSSRRALEKLVEALKERMVVNTKKCTFI